MSSELVAKTKSSLVGAYAAIVAMLIVPQFFLVHPYLHLLIMAPLLVWTGCQRSLLMAQMAPEDSQVETVSKKDAMKFPLIGSVVLFSLYLVVKLVKKEYLDVLIACYFSVAGAPGPGPKPSPNLCIPIPCQLSVHGVLLRLGLTLTLPEPRPKPSLSLHATQVLGAFGIFGCIQEPVTDLLGMGGLKQYPVHFNYQFWRKQEVCATQRRTVGPLHARTARAPHTRTGHAHRARAPSWQAKEPISFKFNLLDVALFGGCVGLSVAYALTKAWYLNNAMGCAFSVQAREGAREKAVGSAVARPHGRLAVWSYA